MTLSSLVLENHRFGQLLLVIKTTTDKIPIYCKEKSQLRTPWELKCPSNPWASPRQSLQRSIEGVWLDSSGSRGEKTHYGNCLSTLGRSRFFPGTSWIFPCCPLSSESLFRASIASLPQTQGTAKLLAAKLCRNCGCSSLTPLWVDNSMTPAGIHPGTLPERGKRNS